MEYVWIILKRDLRSLITPGGKKGLKGRAAPVLGVIGFIVFASLVGYGAYKLFAYLEATLAFLPGFKAAIEVNVLNGTALFVLIMVFLTGIQTTYKTIYESDDIGFLMAQPVPARAIFIAKFVTAYASLVAVAGAFGLPAWFGYAAAVRAGAGFYVVAALSLGLLLLVAHSVVSFLLLLAMRYLPGRKMKQLFIAFSAVFGVFIVLISQVFSSQMSRAEDPMKMIEMLGKGQLSRTWYLPSTWMVNSVLGTMKQYGLNPVPYAAALVIAAVGLSAIAVRVSGWWFMIGWAGRTEETGAGSKRKAPARESPAQRRGTFVPRGAYWTILRKDLRLLFRDPLVWYNLVIGVIVVGFFMFNMKSASSTGDTGAEDAATVIGGAVLMMAVMMGSVTGAQTGGISLSREGPSFWLIRGSPVDARDLFWAKMTYAMFPPTALFALSMVAVEAASFPHYPLWLSVLLGMSMVAAVASLQILLDAYFPDFTLRVEFGSSRSGRGTGKLLTTMFSSMAVVFLMFFIITLPSMPVAARFFPGTPGRTLTGATHAALVVFAAAAFASARYFGVRRIGRILTDM